MTREQAVRTAFHHQAVACRRLGSPFTAKLLHLLADRLSEDTVVGSAILGWPGDARADALPLRLAAALHALVLTRRSRGLISVYPPAPAPKNDRLWQVVQPALLDHAGAVLRFIQRPPQTNEVARSAALVGGFLTVAARTSLPLAIFEIGASAGLNLHWDRFGYDLGGLAIRKTTGLPLLAPAWTGSPPPAVDAVVDQRAGCDRAPVDIRSESETTRLRAYIWPDQPDRQRRLEHALATARAASLPIERADAPAWVEARLAPRREGVATVLFHSIVWQYIDRHGQERLRRLIDDAGRNADAGTPFAWLRMEPETGKAAALRLTLWPGASFTKLADVDYHGRWVHWHAGDSPDRRTG